MPQLHDPFDARLDLVPTNPGVYLMKDASGSIIYVGKAINLRNRLRSYFTANPQGNAKVLAMISHIADFSCIICANELEALILESTLIKQHQPHYNILLRDDKGYPYIRVTMNEAYPRLLKAFRVGDDRRLGARYYGPYLSGDLYRALEVLRHIFPTKTCQRVFPRDIGKDRPCLNYHIGRCIGPCRGDVPASAYRSVMENICHFLEGRYDGLLDDLQTRMQNASDELRFEEAVLWRDRLQALQRLMDRQKAVSTRDDDKDVLGYARNNSEICLQKIEVREGRIISAVSFFFLDEGQAISETVSAFLTQHYPDAAVIPPAILLPLDLPEAASLADYLKTLRQGRCQLHWPQRGANRDLLAMAAENAEQALRRHTLLGGHGQTALQEALRELASLVGVPTGLQRVEAFDISNTGRQDMAASMVVFQAGKPLRQQYRRFKIHSVVGTDDYDALREALRRRLRHLDEADFGSRPDLILVDGGKGHVSAARQVLKEIGVDLPVAGLVKDDRHRTRGLALASGEIIELRRVLAGADCLKPSSRLKKDASVPASRSTPAEPAGDYDLPGEDSTLWRVAETAATWSADQTAQAMGLLRLLTAIQDEAHRFAQDYNRRLLKKRTMRMTLENIPGIGPARRRLLLEQFQGIKGVSAASLDQLNAVPGLGQAAANAVFKHFHPEE